MNKKHSHIEKIFDKRRVFITGHTGFKGSWLSIWLRELGAEVLGYSLEPPSDPNNFEASNLSSKITDIRGDIREFVRLKNILGEFQPEIVFHLAAQPLVRYSYEEPRMTFETNVLGTVNMYELIRITPSVRVFINVTSDKCYENKEWIWGYRENDSLGVNDPYSGSKACAEFVSQAYIKAFFIRKEDVGIASVRAGNVIGGGDWGSDRLLPDCIRALASNDTIVIRNPRAIRPWQHVLEPLYGYLLLAAKLFEKPNDYMGAWNFGPDNSCCISVNEIVEKVISHWGSGDWKESPAELDNNKYEMMVLKLNCDKAHSFLGWRCILDINTAIKMTLEWYKTFYQAPAADMYNYCVAQIMEYIQVMDGNKYDTR